MGFIKAFTGALGGTLADQWKDFYVPQPGVPATAGVFPAIPQGKILSQMEVKLLFLKALL